MKYNNNLLLETFINSNIPLNIKNSNSSLSVKYLSNMNILYSYEEILAVKYLYNGDIEVRPLNTKYNLFFSKTTSIHTGKLLNLLKDNNSFYTINLNLEYLDNI